jgi:hypothetical protein
MIHAASGSNLYKLQVFFSFSASAEYLLADFAVIISASVQRILQIGCLVLIVTSHQIAC